MIGGVTFPVQIKFMGDDSSAGPVMGRMSQRAEKLQGNFKNLAGAFTGLLVARKIQQAISGILRPFMQLETSMMRLQVISGASAATMSKYHAAAEKAASVSPYGVSQLTDAMLDLRKSTGSTEKAMSSLTATAQLAMASFGRLSLGQATDMMGQMARTFGFTGEEATKAADKIFAAVKYTGVSIEDFHGVMGKLGVAAMRGQQGFQDIVGMYSLVKQIMPRKSMASQQLIRLFGEIQKGGTRVQALEDIGIFSKDAQGRMKGFGEILQDIMRLYNSPMQQRMIDTMNQAFGERSIQGMVSMIQSLNAGLTDQNGNVLRGAAAWDMLQDKMNESSGAGKEFSEKFLETADARINLMYNALEKLAQSFGSAFAPAVKAGADMIAGLADSIGALLKIPGIGTMLKVGVVAGILGGAGFAAAAALSGLGRIMRVVTSNLMDSIKATFGHAAAAKADAAAMREQAAAAVQVAAAKSPGLTMGYTGPIPGGFGATQQMSFGAGGMVTGGLRESSAPMKGANMLTGASPAMQPVSRLGVAADRAGSAIKSFGIGLLRALPLISAAAIGIGYVARKMKEREDRQYEEWKKTLREKGAKAAGQTAFGLKRLPVTGNVPQIGETAQWIGGMTGLMAKQLDRTKQMADYEMQLAKERNKLAEDTARKTIEAAKEFKNGLTLGSKSVEDILDRLEGLNKYEFPVAKWGRLEGLASQLRTVQSRLPESDQKKLSVALGTIPEMERIRDISKTRPLTVEETQRLSSLAVGLGVVGSYVRSRLGPGAGLGGKKGSLRKYQEEFSGPMLKSQRPESIEATKMLGSYSGENAPYLSYGTEGGQLDMPWWSPTRWREGLGKYLYAGAQTPTQEELDKRSGAGMTSAERARQAGQAGAWGGAGRRAQVEEEAVKAAAKALLKEWGNTPLKVIVTNLEKNDPLRDDKKLSGNKM